eukprot:scaffold210366_cov33-Prasinocladus_malaysianus.AAC.1
MACRGSGALLATAAAQCAFFSVGKGHSCFMALDGNLVYMHVEMPANMLDRWVARQSCRRQKLHAAHASMQAHTGCGQDKITTLSPPAGLRVASTSSTGHRDRTKLLFDSCSVGWHLMIINST